MAHSSPISKRILSRSNIRYLWRLACGGLLILLLTVYVPAYDWAYIGDDYVQFGYIGELVETPGDFMRVFDPFWSTWYYRPLQNLWLLSIRLLFSHESGILLPPFLLLLAPAQRRPGPGKWLLAGVLVAAATALAAVHLLRPNLTLTVQEIPPGAYLDGQRLLQYGTVEMVPMVTEESAIYAHSFVLTPSFAPYAAAAWYGKTGVAGGSLNRLREANVVGPETYLFGFTDGRLHDLLPALHAYKETSLLWPEGATVQVAGPSGAKRLAVTTSGEEWQTVAVTATVPAGTEFYTAFHGRPGSRFRVRVLAEGTERLIAAGTVDQSVAGWQIVARALPGYWTRKTTFILESVGEGAWAIPRLVR